jgi:DNA-binding NtrC family response regulator
MEWKPELHQPLFGARILIAEDEILIALDMESTFLDAGAEVIGPCTTISAAMDAARNEELSLAILDIRLGSETTERIGDLLAERGIPFLFYSGQALPDDMKKKCVGAVVVAKPAKPQELVSAVAKALTV